MQKPQVFISFRGKDERQKLLPHLIHHLEASTSNVNVFTDNNVTGQPLERLFDHIKNSWMVIVIFSESYLESDWCLNELVEIKRCLRRDKIKFAIPVFYKVKTCEVKKQDGEFGAKFITLKNAFPGKVDKWTKALEFVAGYGGFTYEEPSPVSELDFIKTVVETVDRIFAERARNEIFDKSQLHLSMTLEALNLDRSSYIQGFMHGSAWKNLISFVQSSNRYEIPLPESSIQFPMNRQRFDLQAERNESLEKTTNILALRMMHKPTQPALIFSNWDKLDDEMKKYIIYSAHKKTKMIKSYNVDVDSETLFPSTKFPPLVEELTWDKTLEPMVPQVRPHRDHRRANSFHDNREQFYPLPYEMDWPVEPRVQLPVKPPVEPPVKPRVQLPVKPPVEPLVEAQGSNDNNGQRKVVPKRRDDNPGYFTSLCYCLKSCVCLT